MNAVGSIYQAVMDPQVPSMVIDHVASHLNCPGAGGERSICDLDVGQVLAWVEENVIFTQEDAEGVCNDVEGACDR